MVRKIGCYCREAEHGGREGLTTPKYRGWGEEEKA